MTTSRSIGTTRKPGITAVFDEDHSPRLLRETNAWDIYNNEARKVDNELVKDWTATLNSLLVFAAIFSAVLAAFIIESKKLLEQDYSEAMYDAMVFYMGNLANGTFTPYQRAEFEPSSTAISVNSLFFGSLSASLVAAFASVVVLQWVADFDAVVTRSESLPIEKARRRHFRFTGVENWRMGEIIAALPLILYFSVALFLAGIIQWMLYLHKTVAYVVIAGAILTALFYFSSTLLAVVFISAPYKSPLSRWIYSMYCYPFTLIYRIIKAIRIRRVPRWISAGRQDYQLAHKREDLMVAQMTDLDLQAVEWLIRQVSISDPWHRVVILVGEIARLENERFDVDGFIRSPWIQILNKLFFQSIRGQWRVTREMGHSTEGVSRLLYFKQDLLDATLTRQDIRHFKAKWSDFDREMTGYIRIEYVVRFLVRLSGTLGFGIYPASHSPHALCVDLMNSPRGSFNLRELNERLSELNWEEVKRRRRIQNRLYWETQLVGGKGEGKVSFGRMLAMLGYNRGFEEDKESEIDEYIRGQAFAEELKEVIREDMLKRVLRTIYHRRKFLKWREQRREAELQKLQHNPGVPKNVVDRAQGHEDAEAGEGDRERNTGVPENVEPLTSQDEDAEIREERRTRDVPGTVGPLPLQNVKTERREEPHRQHDSDVPVD